MGVKYHLKIASLPAMATKSETDKYTAKAGIDFAKTAGADSIRDGHGSQCCEANAILKSPRRRIRYSAANRGSSH
jgi:hypothetical protein